MSARLPRRAWGALALAGIGGGLAAAGGIQAAATAVTGATADPDSLLLYLAVELRTALEQEEAACCAYSAAAGTESEVAAAVARDAAFDAWAAIVDRMALVPAAGLAGVCAKAAQLVRASETGGGVADARLTESLRRDLVRLAPGVIEA
ncbi:hypothetical protein [Roseomonas elaeocarpi]|uniref:Uncharacterized protein n=1 Tax=Roseomonas elaeocarpi TaxID=907779 RepID=A0ABV6JYV5_9PROT